MRALPGRDNDLDLQRLKDFSNLLILGSQLSSSHETVLSTTPRTFSFLTHVRPRASSDTGTKFININIHKELS